MTDPVVWLGASLLLVAASLALLMVAALPAIQEIASAARSAEKLFDILSRELPPTLEAVRLTGTEIASLTEDLGQNMQAASRVVGQVDQGLGGIQQQAQQAQVTTRRLSVGMRAAWRSLTQPRAAESPRQAASPSQAAPANEPVADSSPLLNGASPTVSHLNPTSAEPENWAERQLGGSSSIKSS